MVEIAPIPLTEFHNRPGAVIDQSQAGPVVLLKFKKPYAVVVSALWFRQAEKAMNDMHGQRRVLIAEDLADADRDFIMAHGPTDDEVTSGKWRS